MRLVARVIRLLLLAALVALSTLPATAAGFTFPPRVGEREFIYDETAADGARPVIDAATAREIRTLCDRLLTDRAAPVVVVLLRSLGPYGASGDGIVRYAAELFNAWGVGHPVLQTRQTGESVNWNYGMLLVVSLEERKARIELGADWGHRENRECGRIMNELIVPRFKEGRYAEGILWGVKGLDALARRLALPTYPRPWWHYALVLAFAAAMVLTGVSLYRSGAGGWAWMIWGIVFTLLGFLLALALKNNDSASFGGGSFGGGYSGGGGATGSW